MTVRLLKSVDRGDAGMAQRCEELRLPLEASQPLGILRQMRRQRLDRDEAIEPRIEGQMHLSHPPAAELAFDSEGANGAGAVHAERREAASSGLRRFRHELVLHDMLASRKRLRRTDILDRSRRAEVFLAVGISMRLAKRLAAGTDDVVPDERDATRWCARKDMPSDERLRRIGNAFRPHAGDAEVVEPAGDLSIGSALRAVLPGIAAFVIMDLRDRSRGESERVNRDA
jgi:hypothetical protein